MRIAKVDAYVVHTELSPEQSFAYSQKWYRHRTILLCKITTDDGIVGWGEAVGPALVHKPTIEYLYAPLIIGKDPFDTEVIWEELYNSVRDHGQKGIAAEALSAIDIALWDIKGKITGLPVYKLMGGSPRETIVPYATGLYQGSGDAGVPELVAEAASYVEAGFRGMKVKVGFGLDYDLAAVREIRREIGPDVLLMVDANHAYTAARAIDFGRRIEQYDITWFEEPVPPEDLAGYCEVKNALSIPIAGGEAEFTRYGFSRLLGARGVDIVQPDCCAAGGISEFRKIVALASVHNLQCYPHVWGSAVALQTGIHCAFALPDFPPSLNPTDVLLEYDRTPNIFRERLSRRPTVMKDGRLSLPTEPGLGLDVDEALMEKYRMARQLTRFSERHRMLLWKTNQS